MFALVKKAPSCLPIIYTVFFVTSGNAVGADLFDGSITKKLSEEVDTAMAEIKGLASQVRGDKVDKKYRVLNNHSASAGMKHLGYSSRGSSAYVPLYSNDPLSIYLPPGLPEQAISDSGVFGEGQHSQVAGYIRVDNNILADGASFKKSSEQEHSGYSLTLGGDYLYQNQYLFGLTLGLPFYKPMAEDSDTEIDGLIASGYFSYFQNSWYIDFNASYAVMDTDIERQVTLYTDPVVNNTTEADSDIWVFSLGAGYIFDYDYLQLAVESSLQYTLSDPDRYDERLSLTNSSYLFSKIDDVEALESTMLISGVSISYPFRTPFGVFQPYAKGYVHYDIDSGKERIISQLKSNYSGSILPIVIESDDDVYGRVHLGISGALGRDWYGYAEASQLLWHDDLSAYTISVGLSMALD
ncbi:autotransporter outer membrane beta-barrel domain-containing protein (plasmid) [Photobacterium sp. DA100]|uniref:autotransporter outer membrane beta-barrel domain-containing protein n=1 Tax=Photobacterium sp. DA100 TaxID=3027472 RepID=UPI00247A2D6F|nr:autotransporter outer membrane beta-barrel domain-containing protein [Photobacterium sp. DA100]WEM45840.1 autotransporter outer membrane beta-barrel domain-containing protein [Photobacterium sp. DA100]